MKKAYAIVLVALSVIVLSWFLPWLYSIVFPVGGSDPFIAYSPVSNQLIVSTLDEQGTIASADNEGNLTGETFTREQRDSLLPQIYFTQLMAREEMPDSINGMEMSVPALKHNQWVFSSIPHDVNKVFPEVFLIMESMPKRIDLEDPEEVFRFRDGKVEFIDIATNSVNDSRTRRFTEIFNDRGFTLPVKSFSANITSRKAYDEGYLMVDGNNDVFHLKMQAGRPYMVKLRKPDALKAANVFIMENIDNRHLGFMSDTDDNLYIIEKEGYRIIKLDNVKFNARKDRVSVVKNLFNFVVKTSNEKGSQWNVFDSETYAPMASYSRVETESTSQKVASWIFPFELSFSSTSDCYAKPRFEYFSWHALILNVVLAALLFVVLRRRRRNMACSCSCAAVTVVFGIFAFIPLIIINK